MFSKTLILETLVDTQLDEVTSITLPWMEQKA
jgi:hypothetical protein